VIVCSSLLIGCTLLGIRFSFGVFFKSLEAEFELSRAATSSVFSAYMIFAAIFTIASGWALDRWGPRLIVLLMGLITGFSLVVVSQTGTLWQLFLSYSLLLAIGTGGTYIVLMSATSRWFDKKRGLALGIAGSGGPLGTIVIAPVSAYLISNLGWRMSYLVMGLVAWFVVVSLSMLLRRDPREIGLLPDGVKPSSDRTDVTNRHQNAHLSGFSLAQAFRTKNFWLLSAIWLFLALTMTLILTHLVPYITDMGISTERAATVLSMAGGFNILSRPLTGWITDKVGRKVLGITWALIQAGTLLWLIWVGELWMFYLFAIVYGLSWGGLGIVSTALIVDNFGVRNIGVIMGGLDIAFAIGAAIGPALGGFVYDTTGSYSVAFAIGAIAVLIEALLIGLTRREGNV